jgi:L-rhamnose-H+ transport protein
MTANPFLGVVLHAVGGFAAGSFYIPFKMVRKWSWESYWLVNGLFSWIIAPWVLAMIICPNLLSVLGSTTWPDLFWCYFFGVLWGIGGLTFGLSMRYLGMSLGYGISLGFCAVFGTLVPALCNAKFIRALTGKADLSSLAQILSQNFSGIVESAAGVTVLAGIGVCLLGIVVCGRAGMRKEREVQAEQKKATIREFSFVKGVWVAVFAGIMSSCMAMAFAAGKPIASLALKNGAPDLFQNLPVLIVALAGGFTTNFIWCLLLNLKNKSVGDYVTGGAGPLLVNYIFSALAGLTWYFQFFFYSMGTTKMGKYDFSSWTIHMAFIIVFSNLWGIYFREWKGSSKRTHRIVLGGILVLVASTLVVGFGNYLGRPSVVKVAGLKWEQSPGAPRPALSWALDLSDPAAQGQGQTAYQVFVASSPDALDVDDPDLWNSGKVESKQVLDILYGGKTAEPRTCWWKVRVWDKNGRASGWSKSATGMTSRTPTTGTLPK